MTDEKNDPTPQTNLTPAQPITPRRRPPTFQMAQPMRPGEAARVAQPETSESDQDEEVVAGSADVPDADIVDVAPLGEAFSPVQPVMERVASAEVWSTSPLAPEEADVAQAPAVPAVTPAPAVPAPATAPAVPAVPAAPVAPPVAITQEALAGVSDTAPSPAVEPELPKTMRDTLRSVDQAFTAFRAAAERFPLERMDERLSEDGWTRKQMLEHVAAWHDLTADRLVKLINTGKPAPLDRDIDAFNAAVARQAIGKTVGEILKDMDATFNRLRRQMARLNDAQLRADDWWLAHVISANTYGHYGEHWAEIYTPELPPNGRARR